MRGGRGRGGSESTRGGRGRGTERGRGASRSARGGHLTANGARGSKTESNQTSDGLTGATGADVPSAWDSSTAQTDNTGLDSSWEHITPESVAAAVAEPTQSASKPDGKRSWASMFAAPKPPAAPPKSQPSKTESAVANVVPTAEPPSIDVQVLPPPPLNETSEIPNTPPSSDLSVPDVPTLTPSADELTETNLEQVPDSSNPPASITAASTIASTMDPKSAGTPLQPNVRPPLGGFATTAWKATTGSGRSTSFNRKVQEQQEAVVMPGKHAVDRATVQFGSMGLNGTPDDVDVDSDREDAETRTQPPQHSPVAPRASLPPAPLSSQQQQPFPVQPQHFDQQATPRQAPGLPPLNHSAISHHDQPLTGEQSLANPSTYGYTQFSDRYGTQSSQQKPFEPFGHQQQQLHHQPDAFPPSSQPQSQSQPPAQANLSSAGNDVSAFYTSDNQRTYQNSIYGNYQSSQQGQDSNSSQPRTGSAFGTSAAQSQAPTQARFNHASEPQASGHSTPNPSVPGQQPPNQPHQMPQGQPGGHQGGYSYGYPYSGGYYGSYMNHMNQNTHLYGRERLPFDDVRRYDDQYMSQNPQYSYGGGQGGYGGNLFGNAGNKQGMYGQGHGGYGMSPQASYDQQSASPANAGAFGSQLPSSRETAGQGSLSNYGRSGSTQPIENPQQFSTSSSSGHNVSDVFGRSQSGLQGHNQGLSAGMGQGSNEEPSLRGYGDSAKGQGGPSPALGQPSGRPGSAANPQGQSHGQSQGSYGGYPSHMNQQMHGQQSSQYAGGPGGLGGHQSGGQNHQAQGYGGYGGYGANFYGNSNRGGWGNYGH